MFQGLSSHIWLVWMVLGSAGIDPKDTAVSKVKKAPAFSEHGFRADGGAKLPA